MFMMPITPRGTWSFSDHFKTFKLNALRKPEKSRFSYYLRIWFAKLSTVYKTLRVLTLKRAQTAKDQSRL